MNKIYILSLEIKLLCLGCDVQIFTPKKSLHNLMWLDAYRLSSLAVDLTKKSKTMNCTMSISHYFRFGTLFFNWCNIAKLLFKVWLILLVIVSSEGYIYIFFKLYWLGLFSLNLHWHTQRGPLRPSEEANLIINTQIWWSLTNPPNCVTLMEKFEVDVIWLNCSTARITRFTH